jgi:hypothetical protein
MPHNTYNGYPYPPLHATHKYRNNTLDECDIGGSCVKGSDKFPCMCKCALDGCFWTKLESVSKMKLLTFKNDTPILHTNFPVSYTSIRNFRNPLTEVSFYSPKPRYHLGDLIKDSIANKWDMKDPPIKLGWQQPIVNRKKKRDSKYL